MQVVWPPRLERQIDLPESCEVEGSFDYRTHGYAQIMLSRVPGRLDA